MVDFMGFPMVLPWFSHGFPMVLPWFYHKKIGIQLEVLSFQRSAPRDFPPWPPSSGRLPSHQNALGEVFPWPLGWSLKSDPRREDFDIGVLQDGAPQ